MARMEDFKVGQQVRVEGIPRTIVALGESCIVFVKRLPGIDFETSGSIPVSVINAFPIFEGQG